MLLNNATVTRSNPYRILYIVIQMKLYPILVKLNDFLRKGRLQQPFARKPTMR